MEFGEFWQRFTAAEQRGQAFELELLGVKFWPVFRTRIFYRLAQELQIFQDPHPSQSARTSSDLNWQQIPLLSAAENLVVPFRRRVAGSDPYTDDLISELAASGRQFAVLDFDTPEEPADIQRIRDWGIEQFESGLADEFRVWRQQQLNRWHGWRPRLTTPKHYEARWQLLAASLEAEFGVELGDFHDLPRWRLRRFFAQARAFQQHLQSRGVKRVFLVNAYSNPDLVLGAKQAGARVIELQHGFISPMHPAYSHPKRFKSAVLPDEVLVWGEHWRQRARLPRNTKVRVLGAVSQFQETRAALSKLERGAAVRRVLFTSQGAVAEELLGMAMEFARALPEFEIIYRLHPNENLADYERLLKAGSQPQNLSLSHREPRFLDLLLAQPIVVGGFSTTLFEAVGLGLKVIALPLAGREHLASAVAAGDIQLLTERHPRAETIRNIIASASAAKNPQLYYSSPRLPYFLR